MSDKSAFLIYVTQIAVTFDAIVPAAAYVIRLLTRTFIGEVVESVGCLKCNSIVLQGLSGLKPGPARENAAD